MAEEAYVQLPADGVGKKIRLLEVTETQADGSGDVTEYQEVVTLADSDGNLLLVGGLGDTRLPVANAELLYELRQIRVGIAMLLQVMMATGRPKGPLYSVGGWINEATKVEA